MFFAITAAIFAWGFGGTTAGIIFILIALALGYAAYKLIRSWLAYHRETGRWLDPLFA